MPDAKPAKVIRVIARLNVGGPAKHVVWLTAGLDKSRYKSLLVAGKVPPGESDMRYFADQYGITPYFIPEMSREISLYDAATLWKLFALFRREKPDLVHTHTAKAGTLGRVAGFFYSWLTPGIFLGRPRNCKFVHTYHGHIFHSYYGPLKTRLFVLIERILARIGTHRIVVVSDQQREEICTKFRVGKPGQFRVIPLGLDLEVFDRSSIRRGRFRQELEIDDETKLIGIVGRLTEIKNHEMFIDAVYEFRKRFDSSQVRFVIIGDGSLREHLEAKCRSLDLKSDVVFVGERNDPKYFYPALDVVALTSLNEGTPLTLIEAMANARPVISAKVGGVVDLLGPVVEEGSVTICERGIGVSPRDVRSFCDGLYRLVTDSRLRQDLGNRGFEFVQSKYRKNRLLNDVESLYDDLLNPVEVPTKAQSPGRSVQSRV